MMLAILTSTAIALPAIVQEPEPSPEEPWSFSLALYGFDPPDEDSYLSAIGYADRGALHLEARYQYEELDSVSLFVGHRFSWEGDVGVELVPMAGVVGGDLDGVAPGCSIDMTWKDFEWYAESEYVIDLDDHDGNFLYTWSELTWAATEWMSVGLVAQRTRIRDQELEVDRGLLLELSREALSLSIYLFNPDQDDPYLAMSLGAGF